MSELTNNVAWRLLQLETAVKENRLEFEKDIARLEAKLDRLFMAVLGGTLTLAVAIAVYALTSRGVA